MCSMTIDYVALIEAAEVYDVAVRSPLEFADKLSGTLDNDIWLKREDLQPVFSFQTAGRLQPHPCAGRRGGGAGRDLFIGR